MTHTSHLSRYAHAEGNKLIIAIRPKSTPYKHYREPVSSYSDCRFHWVAVVMACVFNVLFGGE